MGKGRNSLHPREGELGSSLPKQLVTQTDTSSLSPAVVQVLSRPKPRWSRPLIVGSARLHSSLQRKFRILANSSSSLVVDRSSNTRWDGRWQYYFYICDSVSVEL